MTTMTAANDRAPNSRSAEPLMSRTSSTDRLAAIKAGASEATEGPWNETGRVYGRGIVFECPTPRGGGVTEVVANRRFIALARQDVPWLVSEVERLKGDARTVEWMREAVECDDEVAGEMVAIALGMAEAFCRGGYPAADAFWREQNRTAALGTEPDMSANEVELT